MEKRGIFLGKTFDFAILESLGLIDTIFAWVSKLRWDRIASIKLDRFSHLIYEFFSSLEIKEDGSDTFPQNTMFFRFKNEEHIVTPQQLAKWLDCDYEGVCNVPRNWDSQVAWINMSVIGGKYDSHTAKSTKLADPVMRILHRFITYSLNARKQINGHVSVKDLILMEVALTGKQVNSATLLIRKFGKIQHEKGEISLGMFVTFICQQLKLDIDKIDESGRVKFSDQNLLNDISLH